MSDLGRIIETNLNEGISHQDLDDRLSVYYVLRAAIGWDVAYGEDWESRHEYADLHVQEALIQLEYAVLALENR